MHLNAFVALLIFGFSQAAGHSDTEKIATSSFDSCVEEAANRLMEIPTLSVSSLLNPIADASSPELSNVLRELMNDPRWDDSNCACSSGPYALVADEYSCGLIVVNESIQQLNGRRDIEQNAIVLKTYLEDSESVPQRYGCFMEQPTGWQTYDLRIGMFQRIAFVNPACSSSEVWLNGIGWISLSEFDDCAIFSDPSELQDDLRRLLGACLMRDEKGSGTDK